MKRFIWITAIFGGGIILLMLAAILLQKEVGTPVADLRTPVRGVRAALAEWNYDNLAEYTDDVSREMYQKMFDDANGGKAERVRKFNGVISAMDAFPSARFGEVKPDEADALYAVADGSSRASVAVGFVPAKTGGYFIKHLRFPVSSTDNSGVSPIVFAEGDNISLIATVDKLFDALMGGSPDAFRSLMMLDNQPDAEVRKAVDDIRAQVMACHADRLRKMVPTVGKLPRGTQGFRVFVLATVEDKKLFLDLDVAPGNPTRIRQFHCGLARERSTAAPSKDNAP